MVDAEVRDDYNELVVKLALQTSEWSETCCSVYVRIWNSSSMTSPYATLCLDGNWSCIILARLYQ